jgi:acyl-CoA thioester hydrolase
MDMFAKACNIRVRYSETDQMGYVYYGNYAQYFEVARVESLRSLGISYKDMEQSGIFLPVLEYQIKYYKPGHYDDSLLINTQIPTLPSSRIRFLYKTYNSENVLLNEAATTLVFVSAITQKPCKPPSIIMDKLLPYFSEED